MRVCRRAVKQSGGRKHCDIWSEDIEGIFSRLVLQINTLCSDNAVLREQFEVFYDTLKTLINASVSRVDATKMMAQHMITRPVFKAMFEHHDFAGSNSVTHALDTLGAELEALGLELKNEIRNLEEFYESVRQRAQGLDNPKARQRMLMDFYEHFFFTTTRKDSERLGIVYTPIEIVDFILESTDYVVRSTFKRGLTDKGVHILDPFTGTGIFLVRLLQSKLIESKDLKRKYRKELHANEIVLLAYYIAIIHIEDAFHRRRKQDGYKSFKGVTLVDTFTLHNECSNFPSLWQSKSTSKRKKKDIQVIIGNPPWSVGQSSSADENPNTIYPEVRRRIIETYAAQSKVTNKKSLYDTYKMAIRWASDKIGRQGVIAFVTNGSFLDSHADSGIRACFAEEFNTIYVVNLRGNQRTQGERSRQEGGKIFGQGSRASVAIVILVKTPNPTHQGCRILYRDIGTHLGRKDKLNKIRKWGSIAGIEDWEEIIPDQHHDWIDQRFDDFQTFYALGTKKSKAGKTNDAIFQLYSCGYLTSRDAYIYSFSHETCARNAHLAIQDYMGALQFREEHPEYTVEDAAKRYSSCVRWDRELKNNLRRGKGVTFSRDNIWTTQYRPFVKQYCYVEYTLANNKYQQDSIFPSPDTENRAICVPGVGSTKSFFLLMVDTMPDFIVSKGQCFPRYRYERRNGQTLFGQDTSTRIDNISDTALHTFRMEYADDTITKDTIFDYIYGILHAPEYSKRFVSNLTKSLPRVPLVQDVQSFHAFAKAGHQLGKLHLGYETCEEYPLSVKISKGKSLQPKHYHIGTQAMRYADKEKTILVVNKHLRLTGIPPEAHEYQVSGRSPLEWLIDRYRITQDKRSGIVNDPNAWFEDPRDLIAMIRRIVYVSVETVRIVKGLPTLFKLGAKRR